MWQKMQYIDVNKKTKELIQIDNLINQNQDIVFYKDELSKSSTYAKIAQVQKEENRKLKDIR